MKKHFVMGYKPEKNMIQNIVSVAYFVEDLGHCKNYETYPFYTSTYNLDKFKSLFMVTKDFKKYTFDILCDDVGRYVVSQRFLDILHQFELAVLHAIPLTIADHKNHDRILTDEYYYIQLELSAMADCIDLSKSDVTYEYEDCIDDISALHIQENVTLDFFIVEEMSTKNQTPICSEAFKKVCQEKQIRGVLFFEIENTPWIKGDVMENYFRELEGLNDIESLKTL